MLTLSELINLLQRNQMVSLAHLNRLRRLAETSPKQFTPRVALKWLIAQGELTLSQAQRLVGGIDAELAASLAEPADESLMSIPLEVAPRTSASPPAEKPLPTPPSAIPVAKAATGAAPAATSSVKPATAAQPVAVAKPAPAAIPSAVPMSGPLEELFNDPKLAAAAGSSGLLLEPPARTRRATWDSPLMLVGGGALLLLLIIGVVVLLMLKRQTGDEVLAQADDEYRNGSYTQAIHHYDYYLNNFPDHARTSYARVQRGTARMRQVVEVSKNWPLALETADEVLSQITVEANFADARPELAAMLPAIAEGLAKRAADDPRQESIDQAQRALATASKPQLVPETLRPTVKLQEVEANIRLAERKRTRGEALASTVTAIHAAIVAGKGSDGYELRKRLLKNYPDLRDDENLRSAVRDITASQRERVNWISETTAAATGEPESVIQSTITLAARERAAAADGQSPATTVVLADGALCGVDRTDGRLLWRRHVGMGISYVSKVLGDDANEHSWAIDSMRDEVVKVDARAGTVQQRIEFDEPIDAQPLLTRQALIVPTRDGSLAHIELASGAITGRWRLPQRLRTTPTADAREQILYQPAEHSILYTIRLSDKACVEAFYLGHEPGSVVAPPLALAHYVFVAENKTSDNGVLHVLRANDDGTGLTSVQQAPFVGRVTTPLLSDERRVFLITDRGALHAYEVTAGDKGDALKKLAELPSDESPAMTRYVVGGGGKLWTSGRTFAQYEAQTARGRIVPSWTARDDGPALGPPQAFKDRVVSVARNTRLPGIVISAIDISSGQTRWSTHLASPPAAVDVGPSNALYVVTADGGGYHVDVDRAKSNNVVEAAWREPLDHPLQHGHVRLDRDHAALFSTLSESAKPNRQVLLVDLVGNIAAWLATTDEVTAPPNVFRNGLLVPLRCGQVHLVNPSDGQNLMEPFQPRIEAGRSYRWTSPVAAGADTFLISDGLTKLYRVGVKSEPKPYLAALSEATLSDPPAASPALLGSTIVLVDTARHVVSYRLPDLGPLADQKLHESLTWGPKTVGEQVLLTTADGALLAIDDRGELKWRMELGGIGSLAGEPLAHAKDLLVSTTNGNVLRLHGADGRLISRVDVGQPLAGGPVVWNNRLVIAGRDGCLHVISIPE